MHSQADDSTQYSMQSARHPQQPTRRRWWLDARVWFLVFFGGLWLFLGAVWWNLETISERMPVITPGIVDSVMTFAAILTVTAAIAVSLLQLPAKLRLAALGFSILATVAGGYGFLQYFKLRTDGDMRPIGFQFRRSGEMLEIESTPPTDSLVAGAESFPQFLGPNRNLQVNWLELDRRSDADAYPVEWRRSVGAGWAGITAVDGLAFTMEQHGARETVAAYRIQDGKRVWFDEVQHRHDDPAGGLGPRSTPTFHDNRLYTLGAVGTLTCYEANTGQVLWRKELTADYNIPVQVQSEGTEDRRDIEGSNLMWGRSASPLIVDDKVVVPVGGPANGPQVSLAAYDRVDGTLKWQGGQRPISYGSPTLLEWDGHRQIVVTNESDVSGYDPESGRELWSHPRPGSSSGAANTSQPILLAPYRLLLTKEYGLGGELIELEPPTTEEPTWQVRSLWKNPRVLKTKFTIAAVRDGFAYALSAGVLECVDTETGERTWRGDRYHHGQMLMTKDHLVIVSESGDLHVVTIDPDDFLPVASVPNLLSGRCWNTLCVYQDRLLVRSDEEMVCVQLPRLTPTQNQVAPVAYRPVDSAAENDSDSDSETSTEQDEQKPRPKQTWIQAFEAASSKDDRPGALTALDGLIREYPEETFAYYQRGCLRCWMGDFKGSVADFDRYVELRPEVEVRMWERGIAYYFAGQFEKGAKQFEQYQTYQNNDVENSAWRYLCQAKSTNVDEARQQLLPITHDRRIPLMVVFDLYAGKATPEDVLEAIDAGNPSPLELRSRQFYGHYYLGIYYEAQGDMEKARTHVEKAVAVPLNSPGVSQYMWDIAKIHLTTYPKPSSDSEKEHP